MNEEEGQVEETQEEETQEEEQSVAPDPKIVALEREVADLKARPPVQHTQGGGPELIPETNFVKPDGYDLWGVDKQMAHIAGVTVQQNQAIDRTARTVVRRIESEADDWYKPYIQEVIDNTDPRYLAFGYSGQGLSDDERKGLHTLAKGKAVEAGKTPGQAKQVPGASPSQNRTSPVSSTSEVDAVLADIKAAGYDRVADSPKIKALLMEKAS